MNDEEFVKLKLWLDAELSYIRVFLAIIFGLLMNTWFVWVFVIIYGVFTILYAGARIAYVERKHRGYVKVPRV